MYVLDIFHGGNTCTTISNGTLSYDSIHSINLSFNETNRYLCPNDHISFSLTDYIDLCAHVGRNIQFEMVTENYQSEINISRTSFQLIELIPPFPLTTAVPSSQPSHLPRPSYSTRPSHSNTYMCGSLFSTMSFIYSQKVCGPESSYHIRKSKHRILYGKGQKRSKVGKGKNVGKGKGYAGTSTHFPCQDYDDLEEHVNIFVFSKANQRVYYDGTIYVDDGFDMSIQSRDFLEPMLDFLIYSRDNRLLQWFQIDLCSMNQNIVDKSFGSVKLTALNK